MSSMKDVSILEHKSREVLVVVVARATREEDERAGTGNIDALKFCARPVNVLFKSCLSASNGTSKISATKFLNSLNDGMLALSLMRLSSNVVGMVTFARLFSEGIVN